MCKLVPHLADGGVGGRVGGEQLRDGLAQKGEERLKLARGERPRGDHRVLVGVDCQEGLIELRRSLSVGLVPPSELTELGHEHTIVLGGRCAQMVVVELGVCALDGKGRQGRRHATRVLHLARVRQPLGDDDKVGRRVAPIGKVRPWRVCGHARGVALREEDLRDVGAIDARAEIFFTLAILRGERGGAGGGMLGLCGMLGLWRGRTCV